MFLMSESPKTRPYYSFLDAARGLAAVSVLFCHYPLFYGPVGTEYIPADFAFDGLPLFSAFRPLYVYGNAAVQFFWMVSGFVFATIYASSVVSASQFFRARFARLYPLHFLTLMVVVLLQVGAVNLDHGFLVYQHNDLYHFMLHLGFASGWGLQYGESFNSPIWSVSIEVIIYGIFWCTLRPIRRWGVLAPIVMLTAFGALYVGTHNLKLIGYCGACFFTGILLRAAFDLLGRREVLRLFASLLLLSAGPILYLQKPEMDGKAHILASLPGVVLLIASLEESLPVKIKGISQWIGDCSYGIYLWHIPIMLALLLLLDCVVGSRAAVSSPWFLLLFLTSAIVAARISFVWFERPMRERLRTGAPQTAHSAPLLPRSG